MPCEVIDDPVGDYVSRRMQGQVGGNGVLDGLALWRALAFCERLGQIESVGAATSLPRQSPAMRLQARSRGIRMTLDLERSVNLALDAVVSGGRGRRHGLLTAYGWIYGEWLAVEAADNNQIRSILFSHAVRHEVISSAEPVLGNSPRQTISMKEAARDLGMGHKVARATAMQAGIIPEGSRPGVAFTIDPDAVAKLRAARSSTLSVRHSAKLLATGKSQVTDLLRAGLLQRHESGGVDRASINRLLKGIRKRSCGGSRPDNIRSMSIAARDAAIPLWRVIKAALEGAIPCWCDARAGLPQFSVRLCDVVTLRATSQAFSIEATARRLGVHSDCARALAHCGIFADDAGQASIIKIDQFEREYIVGSKLAQELGCSPRALVRRLSGLGVPPAFDLRVYRQAIYHRSDLTRLRK